MCGFLMIVPFSPFLSHPSTVRSETKKQADEEKNSSKWVPEHASTKTPLRRFIRMVMQHLNLYLEKRN